MISGGEGIHYCIQDTYEENSVIHDGTEMTRIWLKKKTRCRPRILDIHKVSLCWR
jgi:hypothetical protein